jgi:hypothetical protein
LNKIYILTAGYTYYPNRTFDWRGIYRTEEEVTEARRQLNENTYDWVEVIEIDLDTLQWG